VGQTFPVKQSKKPTAIMPIQESEIPAMSMFGLAIPIVLLGLLYYGLILFCIVKFYQMLSSINDNLAGINRTIAGIAGSRAEGSERMSAPASTVATNHDRPLRAQQCPACGLRVLPTAEGRCPSCQKPIV
jgi:hypothetical protein